jgi:hypothetical protein
MIRRLLFLFLIFVFVLCTKENEFLSNTDEKSRDIVMITQLSNKIIAKPIDSISIYGPEANVYYKDEVINEGTTYKSELRVHNRNGPNYTVDNSYTTVGNWFSSANDINFQFNMIFTLGKSELKLTTHNSVPVDTIRNFFNRLVNNDFTIKNDQFFRDIVIPIDSIDAFSWYESHDSTYVELYQWLPNRGGTKAYFFKLFNNKCDFINIMYAIE